MVSWLQDPGEAVPHALSAEDSREYERRVVAELRRVMVAGQDGAVEIDEVELLGSRPDTLIVFRYHHREQYVGRHPGLAAGPRADVARLWEWAIDGNDTWSRGLMDPPTVLAAAIGSAFDAAELVLVDSETLATVGRPPKIFPRRYDLKPALPRCSRRRWVE